MTRIKQIPTDYIRVKSTQSVLSAFQIIHKYNDINKTKLRQIAIYFIFMLFNQDKNCLYFLN